MVALRNSVQNGLNKCKSSCHEVASEFFRNECTRSTTLDHKLTFCTICVHSGPFGCLTKLVGKRAELVQKFVKRSRIGIFHKEHTRSTPLDPKLVFWCVWYYLGAFGTVWLPYEIRCKTGRTSAKVRTTKLHWNFSQTNAPDPPHWTLN